MRNLTFALLTLVGLAAPAARALDGTAFVSTCSPAAGCTPAPDRRYNQTSPSSSGITFSKSGTGAYTVRIPNLGGGRGNVQVAAVGTVGNHCKVASWGSSGTALSVSVRCFTPTDALVDSKFSLSFANYQDGWKPPTAAYLWANAPASALNAPQVPSLTYSYSPLAGGLTVTRTDVGVYRATIPGFTAPTGHAQVTAYGYTAERCKVSSTSNTTAGASITVRCFKGTAPANSQFTLFYADKGTAVNADLILGGGLGFYGTSINAGSALTSLVRTWSSLAPSPAPAPLVSRGSVGHYQVIVPKPIVTAGVASNVLVTAYGSGSAHCNIESWALTTLNAAAVVNCYGAAGARVDSQFNILFQTPDYILY